MTSSGDREPIRAPERACKLCGSVLGSNGEGLLSAGKPQEDRRLDQVLDLIEGAAKETLKVSLAKNLLASFEGESHQFVENLEKVFSGNATTLKFSPQVQSRLLKSLVKVC